MKVQVKECAIEEKSMIVCCDVGKTEITAFAEVILDGQSHEFFEGFKNRSLDIHSTLENFRDISLNTFGLKGVHVICEPTGGHENRLLATARELGCTTAYVSGEATSKFRTVATNDPEKSDEKDPRIIHSVQKSGVTLTHRVLPEIYRLMRLALASIEDESGRLVVLRNQISATLTQLWPDFSKRIDFLYGKAGEVLVEVYGCDPYLIVNNGWDRFCREILPKSRIKDQTLKNLWADANCSTLHLMGNLERRFLRERLQDLYHDWKAHHEKKEMYKEQLIELYKSTEEYARLSQVACVSDYQMSKLIAETGPLSDFRSSSQILRYAGLNICRRSSGAYVGLSRISKKGRVNLRKTLYQITFSSLIVRNGIYADYYIDTKERLKVGMKAMVSVMRKFLKMIRGLYHSAIPFDLERIHKCRSEYLARTA